MDAPPLYKADEMQYQHIAVIQMSSPAKCQLILQLFS